MDDKPIDGGARPALAAHSKDASAPGETPASSATAANANAQSSTTSGISDTVSQLAGQARSAADRVASSVSTIAGQARDQLSDRGVTTDHAAELVRDRPLMALLAAGGIGLLLGMLIARRD